jgi:DNA-binding MarR family transcriptional regulator
LEGASLDKTPEAGLRDLGLLEEIGRDPDTTQASMATKLGVAVGTVNWHVKRLIAKGYVKVKRAERKKLKYIITPEGIALRARLTLQYVENSMHLYRRAREQARKALASARKQGYHSVAITGDGDIADVCRLTCLENGFQIAPLGAEDGLPVLQIEGSEITLRIPAQDVPTP